MILIQRRKGQEVQKMRIIEHGNNLLAGFPKATEKDPVKLYKALRRIEMETNRLILDYHNGKIESEPFKKACSLTLAKVKRLLNPSDIPVVIKSDPQDYALKIDNKYMREKRIKLYIDRVGYGILAPEF